MRVAKNNNNNKKGKIAKKFVVHYTSAVVLEFCAMIWAMLLVDSLINYYMEFWVVKALFDVSYCITVPSLYAATATAKEIICNVCRKIER